MSLQSNGKKSDFEKISYSKISTFEQCPRKFHLKYEQKKRSDSPTLPLEIGTITHYGKELVGLALMNGEKPDYELIKEIVMNGYDEQAERVLDENMLVIADEKKPVAIAGVMGGLNSEIEDTTNTIVFESAVFNGGSVRLTAKKLGLRTEAAARYEKGLPAENSLKVVNRAIELIEELGVGTPLEEVIDVYPNKQEQKKFKLEADKINKLLGTNISEEEIIKILKSVGVDAHADPSMLTIPYFRQDITNSADIAEEVLRKYGYDKLGTTLIENGTTTIRTKNKKTTIRR